MFRIFKRNKEGRHATVCAAAFFYIFAVSYYIFSVFYICHILYLQYSISAVSHYLVPQTFTITHPMIISTIPKTPTPVSFCRNSR